MPDNTLHRYVTGIAQSCVAYNSVQNDILFLPISENKIKSTDVGMPYIKIAILCYQFYYNLKLPAYRSVYLNVESPRVTPR